jgi:hypothetical protein
MAWKSWLKFDPIAFADKIKLPVQIIESKTAATPQGAFHIKRKRGSSKMVS